MARPKKHETNEAFLRRVMTFAKSGPMMQAFVIDSLAKAAERVASATPAEIEAAFKGTMIYGPAWQACAVELRDEIAAMYGPKKDVD